MPASARAKPRAPEDRLLDLVEAAARVHYQPDTLRKMAKDELMRNRPPLFKQNGRWVAWLVDLDAWVERTATAS